jgi:hypothetical protein
VERVELLVNVVPVGADLFLSHGRPPAIGYGFFLAYPDAEGKPFPRVAQNFRQGGVWSHTP